MNFPWEDIIACRRRKRSPHTKTTEDQVREYPEVRKATCSECGNGIDDLEVFYFKSTNETWASQCGIAGWMAVCIDCQKQIWFSWEIMS